MSGPPWRRALTWLAMALLVWLLWPVFDWAVLKAVFRADANACQALQHGGACWGVVAEKGRWLIWGPPVADADGRPAWDWLRHGPQGGLPLTLFLFAGAWLGSLPLAVLLALGRRARHAVWRVPATAFIEGVRGVPLVGLLFVAAFVLPGLWPEGHAPALVWRAMGVLTVFSAAYMAEILRGGLQTIPSEQSEAGAILGLRWWGIQRRIVLPQAFRAVLPALTGHAIGLLKETSLVAVIGLHELSGNLALSLGGDPVWRPYFFEAYLFIGSLYALLCLALSRLGHSLETRWKHQMQGMRAPR